MTELNKGFWFVWFDFYGFIFGFIYLATFLLKFSLGIAVCYQNFLTFNVLRYKMKKSSSDLLILYNLFSDGLYGVLMVFSVVLFFLQFAIVFVVETPDLEFW